ncbi:hypothetical protein ACIRP0_10625 [Streptomyces sp. NPDC101733]|uniref:hypothetical protein n=1 Tax=unclassified Streptomyces TaxID=2593676 RepID=UPI003807E08C
MTARTNSVNVPDIPDVAFATNGLERGEEVGLMTVAVVAAVRSELRYVPFLSFRASGQG